MIDVEEIQNAILDYAKATFGTGVVFDTDFPDTVNEPEDNNVLVPYIVFRFNTPNRTAGDESFGGARYDGRYMLVDALVVAATAGEARELAYGIDGVVDVFNGFKPDEDAGEMADAGGTVFVRGDGTAVKPRRFIAHTSFRLTTNLITE